SGETAIGTSTSMITVESRVSTRTTMSSMLGSCASARHGATSASKKTTTGIARMAGMAMRPAHPAAVQPGARKWNLLPLHARHRLLRHAREIPHDTLHRLEGRSAGGHHALHRLDQILRLAE